MDFPIADTFTDSLARLAGEDQKAVKTTAFDHPTSRVLDSRHDSTRREYQSTTATR
jgi:hypothetical protein